MTRRILRRLRDERGTAMATAMIVLSVTAGLGAASYSMVATQQNQSRDQRVRESAFNLAEGALNNQIFALSRAWPGRGAGNTPPSTAYFAPCTQASGSSQCPDANAMRNLFSNVDTDPNATWRTSVHDNGTAGGGHCGPTSTFYSDVTTQQQPGYDRNCDGRLWVRARASVRGKTRTLVALVKIETTQEEIPHAALVAGSVAFTNAGNQLLIDANGPANGTVGLVAVRCNGVAGRNNPGCAEQNGTDPPESRVEPGSITYNYGGGDAFDEDDARPRLRARAVADGTIYSGCPTTAQLSAPVVWIENTTTCRFTGNAQVNTPQQPGLIVFNGTGGAEFGGTLRVYGIVYHTNPNDVTSTLVSTTGNPSISGGIIVDGPGKVDIGSSGAQNAGNISYSQAAYSALHTYGTAGMIQNTWREIRGAN